MQIYDKKIKKFYYNWLLISFFMIFTMVIIGGLTRLTNSGLSITEWELFAGILPPLNVDKWNKYFLLYQEIPQYSQINYNMSLKEFKIIFYWEYVHRALGRVIGLFFLLPLIYFHFSKSIEKKYLKKCYLPLFLIIIQGIIGWYMVKSGLVNKITVSHYRLSLHLSLAFIIISIIFWNLLNIKEKTCINFFTIKKYNYIFYFLIFLIFLQIIFGAFVSGLDAGQIYQTWPLMNYSYFPDDVAINEVQNLFDFDNHGLIQFYHRNIAYLIFFYWLIIGFFIFKKNMSNLVKPFYLVSLFLVFQIFLGIITLISSLNIYLALAHQIFSLLLILSVLNLYYRHIN
ncbi:MAG: cytochrome c oxidase assembly protein subunit 15 [Pelagibacterales bacterium]|nr:cytochrome c oxidase assembly protein subunit 15 [Pelagibacterales bacterium]